MSYSKDGPDSTAAIIWCGRCRCDGGREELNRWKQSWASLAGDQTCNLEEFAGILFDLPKWVLGILQMVIPRAGGGYSVSGGVRVYDDC